MLGLSGADGDAEERVIVSHDLMRTVFINMLTYATIEERKRLLQASDDACAALSKQISSGHDAYEAFCAYMRRLLRVHDAVCADIRFKEVSYVAVGDNVHKSTCSHLHGQDHMYDLKPGTAYHKMRYEDLVQIYASRLRE